MNISENQFDPLDRDQPDQQTILEALQNVIAGVKLGEDTWTHKGNYRFNFWLSDDRILCNAFVLSNPDDPNDSNTEDFCYYFEIDSEKTK